MLVRFYSCFSLLEPLSPGCPWEISCRNKKEEHLYLLGSTISKTMTSCEVSKGCICGFTVCTLHKRTQPMDRLGDPIQCAPLLLSTLFPPFFAYAQRKPFFLICRKAPYKQLNSRNIAAIYISATLPVPVPILFPLPVQLLKFRSVFLKASLINFNMNWLLFFMLTKQYLLTSRHSMLHS